MEPLQKRFTTTILPDLQKKLEITNPMRAPRLEKVVINMGIKGAVGDKKLVERMQTVMMQIVGQKPKVTKAKQSIASFKLREGDPIGLMITLRGKRMYDFIEKLINVVFPRIRDFHGISKTSFDGNGNYALGFPEYAIFPEIDPGNVERMQGFEVIMVTTARTDEEGRALLEGLGMPFTKGGQK